jgi:hypothetical protein
VLFLACGIYSLSSESPVTSSTDIKETQTVRIVGGHRGINIVSLVLRETRGFGKNSLKTTDGIERRVDAGT